jgi:hypothetical protein
MFGLDLVRTFEAECDYCGKSYKEGSTNNSNKLFIRQLNKRGWKLLKAGNFCSGKCATLFKNEQKKFK